LSYGPAQFVPFLVSLASTWVFTRLFSPSDYGLYSLIVAGTGLLIITLIQWFQQSILRFLPDAAQKGSLSCFLRDVSVLFLIIEGILSFATLVGLFLICFLAPRYSAIYLLGSVLVLTGAAYAVFLTVFQARLDATGYGKYAVALPLLQFGLSLVIVWQLQRTVTGLIIGMAIASTVVVFLMGRELRIDQLLKGTRLQIDRAILSKFVHYGVPMVAWFWLSQVLSVSDRFIIGHYRDTAEVGIYSSNYNLVLAGMRLLGGPFINAAHPLIMSAWSQRSSENEVQRLISYMTRSFLLVAAPMIVLGTILSRDIVSLLLGRAYHEGYIVIPVVAIGFVAWYLGMYGHKGFELLGKTRVMTQLAAVCALVNVALNVILVPRYGYIAAAFTTTLSYALYPLLVHMWSQRYLPWVFPWLSALRILAASVVSGGSIWAVGLVLGNNTALHWIALRFASSVLVGFATYGGILLALGELRPSERLLPSELLGSIRMRIAHMRKPSPRNP
jgi:O-antigen/teichoic acid export membrane protein